MSQNNMEKQQDSEEVRINLNTSTDKRNIVELKNNTEVVYKPTTMDTGSKWNQNFQSLKPVNKVTPKDSVFLYSTALTGDLLAFAAGISFSWTSPVLPKLQGPESPLNTRVDASQTSMITAALSIGAVVGPFLFGHLADKIGRKKTLLVISVPMIIGMSLLAFTDEVKMYYFGRICCGMTVGGVFTVLTMYVGEITADHNRGKFSCILSIFVALGILYPLSVGSFLSVRNFSLSALLPLQIFLIFFTLYAPESPPYLVRIGKYDEAEKALIDLRSISKDQAQKLLTELQQIDERQKKEKGGFAELFGAKGTRRALMICAGLLLLQQCAGIGAVIGFMQDIFEATGTSIPSHIAACLVGIIQVCTVVVTSSVVEKLGRKLLLLFSAFGAAVSLILLGLYFFLHQHHFAILAYLWWLPIVSLFIYIISFNLGLGPVPWTVTSEVFPDNVKGSASAFVSATCFGVGFFVALAFPLIAEMVGMAQSFWLFGMCCVIAVIFIQCVLPETKGKSVAEIQEILSK